MKNVIQKLLMLLILIGWGSSGAWAVHKFRLLNSSNTQVAYCEGTNTIPSDMVSPLVGSYTYYASLSDAESGLNGASSASGIADGEYVYVKYTLNTEGTELFAGGRYKIYFPWLSKYMTRDKTGDAIGSWVEGSNNGKNIVAEFTLSGDPYSLQIHLASNENLLISANSTNNTTKCYVHASLKYKKFMMIDSGTSGQYLLRLNDETETYTNSSGSIPWLNCNSNANVSIWATTLSEISSNNKKFRFDKQAEPVNVTYHLMNGSYEGKTITVEQQEGSSPSLPTMDEPLNCSINTSTYYTDAACTTANTGTISESNKEFWVTYTFDAATLQTNTNIEFSENYEHAKWMTLRFKNTDTYYLYNSNNQQIPKTTETPNEDKYDFAFIGDPFKFRIVNKAAGSSMSVVNGSGTSLSFDTSGDGYLWSLVSPNRTTDNTDLFEIMLASTYADANNKLYWNGSATPSGNTILFNNKENNNDLFATREASAPTVTFTHSSYTTDKGTDVTITANATLNGGHSITYTAIECKNADGTWTEVKKENTATVSYTVDASEYGNYTYRAVAVPDGKEELIGTSDEVTVTVQYPTVSGGPFTLKLVDKSGNVLFTKENVTGTEVQNSFGDPLPAEWRSPMVTQYKYYTDQGQVNAKNADDTNLLDWTNSPTSTVYVGYDVSDALDLNSSSFSDFNSLMNTRVPRNGDAKMQVRNADSFGKMYMLKFKTSADFNYYAENTKDGVSTTLTTGGSYVYPYTNGDGPIYVYPDKTYQDTRDDGASTRTRYPWFLVSPNNDPYHVYITSWQTSHNQKSGDVQTNYYSYLRTYYNNAISPAQIVTNNVTDDPLTKNGNDQILPTEYMLLTGNGTDGAYKLMTVDAINDGNTTERRTVTSLEQYWRTYPTAQGVSDKSAWHQYSHWVNAKQTANGDKVYENANHYFQTIELGDGSLDIVETNIDGVLVLLDNHGWEIMRHPIVQTGDPDYASVQAELKKYDSPMVSTYKFYATRSVDHKVLGYHKYNINNGTSKALDEDDREGADRVFTSLADYPVTMENGAMADLYVTYDVKEEYAKHYEGAATEADVKKTEVYIRQGSLYAKANDDNITGVAISATPDYWYIKPNFNIDAEMGYQYDVDVNGLKDGAKIDEAATNTNYHDNGQSGFDPYNIQIQNVTDGTKYFTTNASSATLDAGKWSGNGGTVSLADVQSRITPTGYDQTTLAVTNNTFMAVQDANGNMRLMPRFDHGHVVNNFETLAPPADAQAAGDASHAQTTKLSVGSITYKVIDNSGTVVFTEVVSDGTALMLPRRLQSPMVEKYTYHENLENAIDVAKRGIASDFDGNHIPASREVYVGYKVKESFGNGNAWNIYTAGDNGVYMHPVYQAEGNSSPNTRWWMVAGVTKDFANWNSKNIRTSNFPFLDNGYAWEFAGENPDPYNALLFNKGAQMYVKHFYYDKVSDNAGRATDYLTPSSSDTSLDRYCILYFDDDAANTNAVFYNRNGQKFVAYSDEERFIANKAAADRSLASQMVVTQLPQISINVVNASGEVEVTLPGFYKSGCTWTNSTDETVDNTPFYLDRAYAEGHTFYYDAACQDQVVNNGTVVDSKVLDNNAVYVKYTLNSKWGNLNTADSYSTDFKLPDGNYYYWYCIRPQAADGYHFKANSEATPAVIVGGGNSTQGLDNIPSDNASRLSQWAFRGTPYNLHIVNRFHGENALVGAPKAAQRGTLASVYGDIYDEEHVFTTWEFTASLTSTSDVTPCLYLRPQKALTGEAPLLYLSLENSAISLTDFLKGVQLKYIGKADATTVTFKLYDREGSYMGAENYQPHTISDYQVTGVAPNTALTEVFQSSSQKRRYCEYTFYSDAAFTNVVTASTSDKSQTYYVKWDYTDDAPVFSQPGGDSRDYQYYMLGLGNGTQDRDFTLMDVEGEGTDTSPYTFKPNNTVGTPRDLKHQFAIVGNPYGFKLYNRAADKDIKRNAALEITFADYETDGTTPTEEITFDLPVVSGQNYTSTETHFRSTTTGRYLDIYNRTSSNPSFGMSDNASNKTRFRYLIIPVRVFKEGQTELKDSVDYRMYGLEMNPTTEGVMKARTTEERITTVNLRASANKVGANNYSAYDFVHGFCNYTYYRSYNWSTGALSEEIPTEGLSYYGGKEQTKRQFIATYTVDWDGFGKLYLLSNAPASEDKRDLALRGGQITSSVGGYRLARNNGTNAITEARANTEGTYRWVLTGDPYNLQITNLGTGAEYENMPLKASSPTDATGRVLYLTSNDDTYKLSHFELIQRSNGNYVFYLREDTDNDGVVNRYEYNINPSGSKMESLLLWPNTTSITEYQLIPVIPQHNVMWNVVDPTTHNVLVTETVKNVEEGTVLTVDDLPESLRRHYCDYKYMYSDQACTAQYTNNQVALANATTIYVPYQLNNSAPNFVENIESIGETTAYDDYWYEISFASFQTYVYYNRSDSKLRTNTPIETIRSSANWSDYRWVLIGTPYGVQFYNRGTHSYLNTDGNTVTLSGTGTTFDLMDDWQSNLCAIYDKSTGKYLYRMYGNLNGDVITSSTNGYATSVEFSNTNGLTDLHLIMHYSGETLRLWGGDPDTPLKDDTETIEITSFQKRGKSLMDVLPEYWKRAFCTYTFYWDKTETDIAKMTSVDEISDEMIGWKKDDHSIEIHVTYDYSGSPFTWSTATTDNTGKHWYYLVNNHRPSGELGKMVFRSNDPTHLRISESLVDSKLYLSNYEWCVIGDPYGFKLLNRYDPDKTYNEYISVSDVKDGNGEGNKLVQVADNANSIFEMMPGQHSYNFWIHPAYDGTHMGYEITNGDYSFVSNNYNGSNAIIPDTKRPMKYLKTSSAANYRLEIQSDHSLAEYVKYAGFVGGLKYDVAKDYMSAAADNDLSDQEKKEIRALVDNPDNIVQMEQGYYRIIPYAQEGGGTHNYVRGYVDSREQTGSGMTKNLKVETQALAEYDPASIFWFKGTTEDGTDTGHPRYFVSTQGLNLNNNTLSEDEGFKVRYEDLGAAITQLKVNAQTGVNTPNYLSVGSATSTETSINQSFDIQNGVYKTRFYLQKIGDGTKNTMKLKLKVNDGGDGYSYSSFYVPYDIDIITPGAVAFIGKLEMVNGNAGKPISGTNYIGTSYKLRCHSINDYTRETQHFVPAGTPVLVRIPTDSKKTDESASYVEVALPNIEPGTAVPSESNSLKGSYLTQTLSGVSSGTVYVFGKSKTYGVGFFKNSGNITGLVQSNLNVNNNRMYYISPSTSARQYSLDLFELDETTGVLEHVSGSDVMVPMRNDGVYYDLQGRRVGDRPSYPGVYIVNGKKVVIK